MMRFHDEVTDTLLGKIIVVSLFKIRRCVGGELTATISSHFFQVQFCMSPPNNCLRFIAERTDMPFGKQPLLEEG